MASMCTSVPNLTRPGTVADWYWVGRYYTTLSAYIDLGIDLDIDTLEMIYRYGIVIKQGSSKRHRPGTARNTARRESQLDLVSL